MRARSSSGKVIISGYPFVPLVLLPWAVGVVVILKAIAGALL